MRLPVEGTVASGELRDDFEMYYGVAQGTAVPAKVKYDVALFGADVGADRPEWLASFPAAVVVDEAFLERGRARYGIYCSVCHGNQGNGAGAVAVRAQYLDAEQWGYVAPKALHSDNAKSYSNGELFHIASHGISTMSGYASQVPAKDRWAIVAYIRAIQATQALDPSAAPQDVEYQPVPTIDSVRVSDSTADGE